MEKTRFYQAVPVIRTVLLLLAVLGCSFTVSVTSFAASAASGKDLIPGNNIELDYDNQLLQITTTEEEIMTAFPAVKVDAKGAIASIQVKKWDIYDRSYMEEIEDGDNQDEDAVSYRLTVDLSPINTNLGGYVALKKANSSDSILIHFPAVSKKLSASYDQQTGLVTVIDKAASVDDDEYDKPLEYRTLYGNWQEYKGEETNLRFYEQQGATLYFRQKTGIYNDDAEKYVNNGPLYYLVADSLKVSGFVAEELGPVDGADEFYLYDACSAFSGNEIKVKIPKLKDGPAVTFNYAKRTITVKKNCEYRTDCISDFTQTPLNKTVDLAISSDGGRVEVRTPSSVDKKNKFTAASKIAAYVYPPARTLAITADDSGYLSVKADRLAVTYNAAKKRIEFTSTDTDNTYLVYIARAGAAVPAAGSTVSSTVKPGKITYLSKSKVPAGSRIYAAYAADSKNKLWATEPVLLGTAD